MHCNPVQSLLALSTWKWLKGQAKNEEIPCDVNHFEERKRQSRRRILVGLAPRNKTWSELGENSSHFSLGPNTKSTCDVDIISPTRAAAASSIYKSNLCHFEHENMKFLETWRSWVFRGLSSRKDQCDLDLERRVSPSIQASTWRLATPEATAPLHARHGESLKTFLNTSV